MGNAEQKLKLLVLAFALAAARQGHLAADDAPGLAEQETVTEFLPSETQLVPGDGEFVPGEFAGFYAPLRPLWYFKAEGLALKRDASGDQAFAGLVTEGEIQTDVVRVDQDGEPLLDQNGDPVLDQAGDPVLVEVTVTQQPRSVTSVLGTQDLDFDFRAGGRALVGRMLGDWYAIEVCYFGLNDWDERSDVRDVTATEVQIQGQAQTVYGSLVSPFSDFGDPSVLGLDYNNYAFISYSSSLHNIEWNLRRRLDIPPGPLQASVLIGGRYLTIRERFYYYTESEVPPSPTTNAVTTQTGNDMLGVQFGALFEFQVEPRWRVDCEIKGAMFDNFAEQNTNYVHSGYPLEAPYRGGYAGKQRGDTSTFALDLSLALTYQVNPRLSARVGYQALWVDGLALASENFDRDMIFMDAADAATLVSSGRVVYHGAHVGITWAR